MFEISSNQSIKISRGDNADFPLFLNKGTVIRPIRYSFGDGDGCEVYFYILAQNQTFTYDDNGQLVGGYITKITIPSIKENINDNGDMIIRIQPQHTSGLQSGKYYYQIKAKVKDSKDETKYVINTVTNKNPFYVVEDEFNRSWS